MITSQDCFCVDLIPYYCYVDFNEEIILIGLYYEFVIIRIIYKK